MIQKIRPAPTKAQNPPVALPATADNYQSLAKGLLYRANTQKTIFYLFSVFAILAHINFFSYLIRLKDHSIITYGITSTLLVVSLIAGFMLLLRFLENIINKITLAKFFLTLDDKNLSWQEACAAWPEDSLLLLSYQPKTQKKSQTGLFAPLLAHKEKAVRLKTIQAISQKPPRLFRTNMFNSPPFP